MVNPGFETDAAWVFPPTAYTAGYGTGEKHSGLRSMRTGVVTLPDVLSYSSGNQLVTIPAAAGSAILHFWYYPFSQELGPGSSLAPAAPDRAVLQAVADNEVPQSPLANDLQYVLVLDEHDAVLETIIWTLSNASQWLEATFDLSAYRGRTVQLRFGTYNDGNGQRAAMWVDDVSLTHCADTSPTSTPTPSPPVLWLPFLLRETS